MKTIDIDATASVRSWLEQFAACVRARDLAHGRALFDPQVRSFGTRVESAHNLDELVERQWRPIWFSTSGFHFVDESVHVLQADDQSQVVVLARWESTGASAEAGEFPRRGRCTLVLRPAGAEGTSQPDWRAVHTHFSLWR